MSVATGVCRVCSHDHELWDPLFPVHPVAPAIGIVTEITEMIYKWAEPSAAGPGVVISSPSQTYYLELLTLSQHVISRWVSTGQQIPSDHNNRVMLLLMAWYYLHSPNNLYNWQGRAVQSEVLLLPNRELTEQNRQWSYENLMSGSITLSGDVQTVPSRDWDLKISWNGQFRATFQNYFSRH